MSHKNTIESALADIRAQLEALAGRIAMLERSAAQPGGGPATPKQEVAAKHPSAEPIPEQDILAIAAALAAHFGVRVRVRQIRLIGSSGWAQQGRVSVQASHRLH